MQAHVPHQGAWGGGVCSEDTGRLGEIPLNLNWFFLLYSCAVLALVGSELCGAVLPSHTAGVGEGAEGSVFQRCRQSVGTNSSEDFKRCSEMVCNGNHHWIPPSSLLVRMCGVGVGRPQTQGKGCSAPYPFQEADVGVPSPGWQFIGKDPLDDG